MQGNYTTLTEHVRCKKTTGGSNSEDETTDRQGWIVGSEWWHGNADHSDHQVGYRGRFSSESG